jgi:hypothetical protein
MKRKIIAFLAIILFACIVKLAHLLFQYLNPIAAVLLVFLMVTVYGLAFFYLIKKELEY